MSSLLTFIWAVLTSWFGLIGAATIVAAIVQYLLNQYFLPKAWIAAGIILFFVASYQTWYDQRASYMTERCKVQKFEDRSAAKNQLAWPGHSLSSELHRSPWRYPGF
jgi:putative Ca2+/H+ antiporter (TMEM165/GDT1 family)